MTQKNKRTGTFMMKELSTNLHSSTKLSLLTPKETKNTIMLPRRVTIKNTITGCRGIAESGTLLKSMRTTANHTTEHKNLY